MHFKVRSKGGHFAPLEGAVRQMPEALTIRLDMSMKIMIFTVGWTDMVGEFNVINTPHERGWAMRFAKEPEWHLPPTVGYLLKSRCAGHFRIREFLCASRSGTIPAHRLCSTDARRSWSRRVEF